MYLVLGLGVSGIAAAELLLEQGHAVIGFDDHAVSTVPKGMQLALDKKQIDWASIEEVVISPGVSLKHPVCGQALQHHISVIGEAELAFRSLRQPMVAVTGTNGKTTVTLLIAHVLNLSGIKAVALGNVGYPLCRYVKEHLVTQVPADEVLVVELSSYQLETMSAPVFDGAALLNITPDHLDRYPSMEEYAQAKCHLQRLLKSRAPLFVHRQVIEAFARYLKPGYLEYGRDHIASVLPLKYRELEGVEIDNIAAAFSICSFLGVSSDSFFKALDLFQKPHHRIEFVDAIDEVHFFDDSKGTNVDAVIYAVQAMKGPVILIAGGVDKGASYLPWKAIFSGKVKRIVVMGKASQKIFQELHPDFAVDIVDSLSAAVDTAFDTAVKGDHILLSPGCASYDMFRDYAHRGQEFQKKVHDLRKRRRIK